MNRLQQKCTDRVLHKQVKFLKLFTETKTLFAVLHCKYLMHEKSKSMMLKIMGTIIEDITWWLEDVNFIFEWQNNILRTSATSE